MLRRSTPSSASLVGGDLSVDILHTEDSVRLGDGTNLLSFQDVLGTKTIPVKVLSTTGATDATLTNGTQRSKLTDGTDNVEIDDVGGEKALKVSVIASVGGGGGGTAATDSAAYTPTASQFTPIGGAYDDVSSDALAEGEMGLVRMTSGRALHVAVQNSSLAVTGSFYQATQPVSIASALPVTDNGGSLTVDGSVGITGSVAVTGTFYQATQPVSLAAVPTHGVTGTFWQATQPVSIASSVTVADGGGSLTVDGTVGISGTVPVSGTFYQATQPVSLASVPTHAVTQSGTWTVTANSVTGQVAHDAAASGNPLLIAGRATDALPTEVASNDASFIMTDRAGRVVTTNSPRALVAQATGSQATTTEATMLAAAGSGVFHDLTQIILTNSNATTAAQVQIRDTTSGTIRFEHMIPANSGMVVNFPTPFNQTTANTNWTIKLNAAVSTVYYTVQALKRT